MSGTPHAEAASPRKARVYALADPGRLQDHAAAIGGCVLAALGVPGAARDAVRISEASAWVDYTDQEALRMRAPPALPSAEHALRAAEAALSALARACGPVGAHWPAELAGISLLPPAGTLRRAGLAAVPRADRSCWDHWLYRAQPHLDLDLNGGERVPVLGSQVEVRIGHGGRVVGLRSRWHPLSSRYVPMELRALAHDRPPNSAHAHGVAGDPFLGYALDGDGIPQYYLAPYYFRAEDHVLIAHSAGPWSLTVDIGRVRQDSSRMTLLALALGGSGDYEYRWAACAAAGPSADFRELGSGSHIDVQLDHGRCVASRMEMSNGVYLVMLNVRDRASGAFKHHQQLVASSVRERRARELVG